MQVKFRLIPAILIYSFVVFLSYSRRTAGQDTRICLYRFLFHSPLSITLNHLAILYSMLYNLSTRFSLHILPFQQVTGEFISFLICVVIKLCTNLPQNFTLRGMFSKYGSLAFEVEVTLAPLNILF
jgi:hypothetical protein